MSRDLQLAEGEIGHIKVSATAPPAFLCAFGGRDGDCSVAVVATAADVQPLR